MCPGAQGIASESESTQLARHLEAWITGRPLAGVRAIAFIAERESAHAALGLLGPDDIAIVPAGSETQGSACRTIEYTGRFVEVGDELTVGGLSVELCDYLAAAFVEILGPTAVVMNDEAGWAAFLADADSALHAGVFVPQLHDPSLLLAGRQAFLAPAEPVLFRPHFLSDGLIRNGLEGPIIGRIEEPPAGFGAPPRSGPVDEYGGIAEPELIAEAISSRPWLPRYIRAYELAARVHATPSTRISGFGFTVAQDGLGDAVPDSDQPFLYEEGGEYVVGDLRTGRRTGVGPQGAVVVDIALSSSSEELALSRVARALKVTTGTAAGLLDEVGRHLGIEIAEAPDAAPGVC